ncbi:MAG: hypothetical protein CV045_02860 [Cyanobacteria bacterium M5B4]|nr:MAG: hypothetical protein CV045_02860 [Cyanobacteria bacterium M5B4]
MTLTNYLAELNEDNILLGVWVDPENPYESWEVWWESYPPSKGWKYIGSLRNLSFGCQPEAPDKETAKKWAFEEASAFLEKKFNAWDFFI